MKLDPKRPRQIQRIHIVNVGGLREAELTLPPGGRLLVIGGANSSGKSSLCNALIMALKGARADISLPITQGANEAVSRIEYDDFVVTVTWEKKGGSIARELFVERIDGEPIDSAPQTFLNAFAPDVAFDPTEFSRLRPKERVARLKEYIGIDLSDLDEMLLSELISRSRS